MTKTRHLENPACTSASASSTVPSLPSAVCPCAQHSLHPGGAKPPNPGVQCHCLVFIHLILHHFCCYWCVFLLLQNGFYWLSKDAFILVVSDVSFSFVPSLPLPISRKPMGEVWCLSLPFSLCEWTLPHPTVFSACTSPKPRFQRRPRHIDPSTWWAAVPEDHGLTQNPLIWSI